MLRRKNQFGFSHHLLLPLIAIVGIGAIGVYLTTQSHAGTAANGNVVYKVKVKGQTAFSQYLKNVSGQKTQYSSEVGEISDISLDQKWILTKERDTTRNVDQYVARSLDGATRFAYPAAYSNAGDCTAATYVQAEAKFAKVMNDTTPPKIYFAQNETPCVGAAPTYTGTAKIYSMDVDDQNITLVKQYANTHVMLFSTSTTGTLRSWVYDQGYKIIQASGATYSPGKSLYDVMLSENGKKVAISGTMKGVSGVFVGNSDGTSIKRVIKTAYQVTSMSPDGKKLLYQKGLDKKMNSVALYSYDIAKKKTVKLDSGFGRQRQFESAIQAENWSHDSGWILYTRIDKKTSKAEVRKVKVNGTGKTVVAGLPYATTNQLVPYW